MTEQLHDRQNYVVDGDVRSSADVVVEDAETGPQVAQDHNGLDCAVRLSGVTLGGNAAPAQLNALRRKTPREEWDDKVEALVDKRGLSYDAARKMVGPEPVDDMPAQPETGRGSLESLRTQVDGIRKNPFLSNEEKDKEIDRLVSLFREKEEDKHRFDDPPYVFVRPEL